jgi:hypothetical protein
MKDDNRVLSRRGAKELTPGEIEQVNGGFTTLLSVCSIPRPGTQGCDSDVTS